MNDVGAKLTVSSARKLLKDIPYRNGIGNERLYKFKDAEFAFNKSFLTTRQRLGIEKIKQ